MKDECQIDHLMGIQTARNTGQTEGWNGGYWGRGRVLGFSSKLKGLSKKGTGIEPLGLGFGAVRNV